MFKKIILFLLVVAIGFFGGLYFFFGDRKTIVEGRVIIVRVEDGMAAGQIARLLEDAGVIGSARAFSAEAAARRLENSLQAGEYELITGMSDRAILEKIAAGDIRRVKITIPEGFNVKQIAALLAEKKLADKDKFLAAAKNYTPYEYMVTDDKRVEYKAEGFLFPSTYNVAPNIGVEGLLAMLAREFDSQLTGPVRQRLPERKLSVREYVTLASLVEKEAAAAEDRKFIAKAFLRRLDIYMPLQSCATIQYILGYPKAELTVADTKLPSDYNTYLHYGLPPGPIANPGSLSMQAVLSPAEENYLYFVAKKDGRHIFSYTYEEHLAAIDKASR
jgi:UPF0755 protein